ncbi:MAG: phosphopyruvate hydratase [Pirellulales bacterium]|nr:phosphopyruvate hydratase [Pirellulales bacterium]
MSQIKLLTAREILDSRGRPTIEATCQLVGGVTASASVPSGASTGAAEARELRDGDAKRYGGMGCRRAVDRICNDIQRALGDREFSSQRELDQTLIALDGTPHKSRLGANAILAVSIAFARAQAIERGIPLYRHFAQMLGQPMNHLPRLTINLFSGGKHAGGQVSIQDVLIVPTSATTIDESLVVASVVYQAAVTLIHRKYNMRWLTADEGGLAPPAANVESLLDDAVEAIRSAGLTPGEDVCLALDVASSHFYDRGRYRLDGQSLDSEQMIDRVAGWMEHYPIVSVEDALAEDDWDHWPLLTRKLAARALVLGDDLLCTHPERIRRAIDANACNALLLKVNQIGTLSEALDALRLARSAQWNVTVSVRSGDTEDHWFADLAVGWSGDQSKAGSITQSERLAKYNRLLAIEAELNLPIIDWPRS